MKKILCATYEGLDAKVVDIEVTLTKGLPSFSIVGDASSTIKIDSKDRIKSALLSNDFKFPPKRITVNLAPADDFKKNGSQFDLGIALMILLDEKQEDYGQWFVFGELGLDGGVKENNQLYPLLLSLANQGMVQKVIVPFSSLSKLTKIPNLEFYGVKNLAQAMEVLENQESVEPNAETSKISYPSYEIQGQEYFYMKEYEEDFSDVKGQEVAKRAALISATGFHNILFEGSPGCGKSMISKRLRYILPPMTSTEILDVAKLQALDCKDPDFQPRRPYRAPHHSSTSASVFGGGSYKAMIGEVGLAHSGILMFDEIPHFSKRVLEALREPLEDGKIRISRVNSKVEYPSDFLFIGAMNPCPCGNLLDAHKECRCSDVEIKRYKNRLSDPFLDRIDLSVVMQNVKNDDVVSCTSKELHKKVLEAHIFAKQRKQEKFNAKLDDAEIESFCIMDIQAKEALEMAISKFNLSFRSIKKVQKISRTIADLENSKFIEKKHLLEALSYRRR